MAVLLSASKNPKLLRRLLFAISIFMDLRTSGFLLISLREAWSPQTGIANGVARPCRKVAQKWFRTLESLEPPNQDHWLKSVGQTMWNCFTLSTKYLNYRKKLQNVHFPTDIHVCIYMYIQLIMIHDHVPHLRVRLHCHKWSTWCWQYGLSELWEYERCIDWNEPGGWCMYNNYIIYVFVHSVLLSFAISFANDYYLSSN